MKTQKLSNQEKQEVRRLFWQLTTKELHAHINAQRSERAQFGYTTFRTLLYKMNLKKCSILRWTPQETQYLLDNYKTIGNTEIAKNLSTKKRPFNKKNVEKKMILLGIKRTREELNNIIAKHKERGVYSRANYKRWNGKRLKEGETTIQIRGKNKPIVMVKANGKLTPYARHRYLQLHGSIPKGYKIYFKDMNPLNIADNNLVAQQAHGLTEEQRAKYNYFVRKYFASIKINQEVQTPQRPTKKQKKNTIPVRLDSRTVVYVKPGVNIAEFKQRYFERSAV